MRRRIALGGVSVTAVLGLLLLFWTANFAKPVSAMERMADGIRQAKSYTVTMFQEVPSADEAGKQRILLAKITFYWLTPGFVRMDSKAVEMTVGGENTQIFPADKPGISIDHKTKTFRHMPARRGHVSPLMMLEALGKYAGQADRELGTKDINGRKISGFVIDAREIDPGAFPGTVEIWIDAESSLPVKLCYDMKLGAGPVTLRMTDFRWNVDLDPKLFAPTPPDGYADATRKPPSLDDQIGKITETLKLYAELSGGHYPCAKMIYGDVVFDEMQKMAGVEGLPAPEQFRDEKFIKIQQATPGLATINGILRDNSDAAYHGLTVGSKDKDKVLLRWKLDNDRYQVIYGDLRSESVTAMRLGKLEGR